MQVQVKGLIPVVNCPRFGLFQGICSAAPSWSWSTSMSGTKLIGTHGEVPEGTGSPAPHTALTAACTEPGRFKH